MKKTPNKLIHEKSPYLLQHSYNPVDWYPWCSEAFEMAKIQDKPIFLSIGYSTCHWCHVMKRESFEDEEVAEILNKVFICIKVDREERPDIDAFYMDICTILNGRGGWPLNIFMTYEKKPFYACTYIPKESLGNLVGIKDLAKAIDYYWKNKRQELLKSSNEIMNIIMSFGYEKTKEIDQNIFNENFTFLANDFDEEYGGFGNTLKFPPYNNLFFLINHYQVTKNLSSLMMVEKTLNAIRSGGIFDFLAGGIHRYSTDRFWKVPHFEKMLYDQALMSILYSKAYMILQKEIYLSSSKEIISYCLEYLKNEEGGFFCGEDADSEGEEGKFYQWEEDELKKILTSEEFIEFCQVFSISKKGNFRDEITGEYNGRNILFMTNGWFERYKMDGSFRLKINEMLKKLNLERNKRIRPNRDEKILFDWNCLMIIALLYLFRITNNEKYKDEALKAIDFLEKNMIDTNLNISHAYFKGTKKNFGFLEDYSYLLWCYIELYETFFYESWFGKAILLVDRIIERFWDEDQGGFFHSPVFFEEIPIRQKIIVDNVMPSGNSILLQNLLKLHKLTGEEKYFIFAKRMVEVFSDAVLKAPLAYNFFINSLFLYFDELGKISIVLKERQNKDELINLLGKIVSLDWTVDLKVDSKIGTEILAEVCSKNTCIGTFKSLSDFKNYIKNNYS